MPTEGEWERRGTRVADGNGDFICTAKDKDTARRIVTAVNCHEELVVIAEKWRIWVAMCAPEHLARIDAVLAKAREGEG